MIREYNYLLEKNRSLSPHFKVKEFADEKKDIRLDEMLIIYLELIFQRCHASKITITSGYRSPAEDIKVGGNGRGYHTKGQAVDFIVYDKDNKIIDSKYICCVCQCLGILGIAKISTRATHIDTRQGRYYYGDETKSLNTVTSDYFEYFNLSMKDVLDRLA